MTLKLYTFCVSAPCPCCSANTSSSFLPQDLCACCFLYHVSCLDHSDNSSLLKCHLFRSFSWSSPTRYAVPLPCFIFYYGTNTVLLISSLFCLLSVSPLERKIYEDEDCVWVTTVSPALRTVSSTLQALSTYSMNEWVICDQNHKALECQHKR